MPNLQKAPLGFITDIHFKSKIQNRNIKDFLGYQLDQLRKAFSYYKSMGVKQVLLGGDVFDQYTEFNSEDLDRIVKAFSTSGLVFHTCYGNHDLKGNNLDESEIEKTSLYLLSKTCNNFYNYIDELLVLEGLQVRISSWKSDTYHKVMESKYDEDIDILVLHAPITLEPTQFTKGINDINASNVKLILLGDQHGGVPKSKHNKVTYYSPGAFSKLTLPERYIKTCIPVINSTNLSINTRFLEEDSSWIIKDTSNQQASQVITSVRELAQADSSDYNLTNLVKKVGKAIKVSDEIVEIAIKRINE